MNPLYRTARKAHTCTSCGGTIKVGSSYLDRRSRSRSKGHQRLCLRCADAGKGLVKGVQGTALPRLTRPYQTAVGVTADMHKALLQQAQEQGVPLAEIGRQAMAQARSEELRASVSALGRPHRLVLNFEHEAHVRINRLATSRGCPRSHVVFLALRLYIERRGQEPDRRNYHRVGEIRCPVPMSLKMDLAQLASGRGIGTNQLITQALQEFVQRETLDDEVTALFAPLRELTAQTGA